MFVDALMEKIDQLKNPSVMGLDPVLSYIPEALKQAAFEAHGKNLKGAAEAIWEFNKGLLDAVYDIVPCVKLQVACYEMYGLEGLRVMAATMDYAKKKGLLVIADGKRNDIGSSAGYYAKAFLGKTLIEAGVEESAFRADCLTVNPYLGGDGIEPFLTECKAYGKGIFVLVKTSNPSSGEFQDQRLIIKNAAQEEEPLYETVARKVRTWGEGLLGKYGYSSVGAVVGATYPQQAKRLRALMAGVFFLVPGYGAQGGGAQDVVPAFDAQGKGAIVNASRSILCAYQAPRWKEQFTEAEFAAAARAEALRMREDIMGALLG